MCAHAIENCILAGCAAAIVCILSKSVRSEEHLYVRRFKLNVKK